MFENSSVSPEHHESYGLARFSRIGGKSGKLFGSSIEHHHFIELTISRASRSRQFQHDQYMPDQELISVFMSPAQFAELLTSLNVGTGVPVTIKHINQQAVEECPEHSFMEQAHADMAAEFKHLAERFAALSQATTLLENPGQLKAADKKTIKAAVDSVLQEVRANIPFFHKCFQEACDRTVADAKASVDAAVIHAQVQLGKETCEKLGMQETTKGWLE